MLVRVYVGVGVCVRTCVSVGMYGCVLYVHVLVSLCTTHIAHVCWCECVSAVVCSAV